MSAFSRVLGVVREDHLLDERQPVRGKEHVLGAAKSDALGAELACHLCIARDIRIRAHTHGAHFIGPRHERAEIAAHRGFHGRDLAEDNAAGAAVDGDVVSQFYGHAVDRELLGLQVDLDGFAAGNAGFSHAAGNHCRVGRHAAARRENALGRVHAVNIVGRGLGSDENDRCFFACFTASSAVKTTLPEAAPGDAGRPLAITWIFALGSMMGWRSWSRDAGSTRSTASSLEISFSPTMSTAILTAAWAVRLPVRVWSM